MPYAAIYDESTDSVTLSIHIGVRVWEVYQQYAEAVKFYRNYNKCMQKRLKPTQGG